jgi:methylaspartate ammonia-lyase
MLRARRGPRRRATIVRVLTAVGRAGFFTDDQAAIRAGAPRDGFDYAGSPVTPGFDRIREPGVAVSVLLVLSDGQVAVGDCTTVQYAGAAGRDPVIAPDAVVRVIGSVVAPALERQPASRFRSLAALLDDLRHDGSPLPAAIRYGVSQALLDAVALAHHRTMAEIVRDEYDTGVDLRPVPLFAQSGDDRYDNVDKMILKQVDVLPHGLINEVASKLGRDGELLEAYVAWVRDRILAKRATPAYHPVLHFDTYGTIGIAFGADTERIADYITGLGRNAEPFRLRIEHPIDAGSRAGQVDALVAIRQALAARRSAVQLVVDEWCNTLEDIEVFVRARAADVIHVKTPDLGGIDDTIEALLTVRRAGLGAYCGGTCNETERSARVCAHVAMACAAEQVLAKPGMGVDEGLTVTGNEMARVAVLVAGRAAAGRR